jgi:thiol-disulfide isomerase/thioredoxin
MNLKPLVAIMVGMMAAVAATYAPQTAGAQIVSLPLRQGGVATTIGNLPPRRTSLGPGQLIGVKKQPEDLTDPLYASFELGPKGQKTTYCLILDEVEGKLPRLLVDTNHNGDLTDDPPVVWRQVPYNDFNGKSLIRLEATVTMQVPYGSSVLPLNLVFMRLDPRDPNFAATRDEVLYMADYVREGKLKLGTQTYKAALLDAATAGDFRGNYSKNVSGTLLLIDVNGNGRIDGRGEIYDANQPFNIKGITYELHVLTANGSKIELVKSKRTVAEIPPPPDLRAGKQVIPFEHKLLDGKTVHFPDDYKGKLVLLYFWADWCPDCAKEMPNVIATYAKYHARGVDILGVSIERDDHQQALAEYTQTNKIPWPQTYDGKLFAGQLAKLYFVLDTPTPFLVDGATGKILATREDLIGPALSKTLDKFLAQRKR